MNHLQQKAGATGVPHDGSASITTGGAAQDALSQNPERNWLIFQNLSDTAMYINVGADATAGAGSILIPANGGFYENPPHFCPSGRVSVICATTGKAFTCKEA